jgi:CHAT domain-containing protein
MSNRKKLILNKEKILELAEIFYENKNKFISILLEIANKNYINKSKAFFEAGNYLKNNKKYYVLSIEAYRKAIMFSPKNYNEFHIVCYGNIGIIYGKKREHIKALQNFYHCLRISKKMNHLKYIAQSLVKIGIGYFMIEKYKISENYFEEGIAKLDQIKDKSLSTLKAESNKFLGRINNIYGNYEKALSFLGGSLIISTELRNEIEEADLYINIGSVYYNLGDQNKNIYYQKKALRIYKKINDKKKQADCYNNLGNAYMDLGKTSKSLYNHNKALKIRIVFGDKIEIANSYNNIGVLNLKLGEYSQVIFNNSKSLQIYREVGSKSGVASSLACVSIANINKREFNKAEGNLLEAIKLFEELNLISGIIESRLNLARLYYEELDNLEGAYDNCHIALNYYDNIFSNITEEQNEFNFISTVKNPYSLMIKICVDMNKNGEALEFVERSKAKAFLKLMKFSNIKPKMKMNNRIIQLLERENSITMQISNIRKPQTFVNIESKNYFKIEELKSELEEIYKEIAQHDKDYVSIRTGKSLNINQIKKLIFSIKSNVLFVEYYMAKVYFYIFLVYKYNNKIKVDVKKVKKSWKEINNFINSIFLSELKKSQENPKTKCQWQYLAEFLVEDIFIYINKYNFDGICIIPNNILFNLPVHAIFFRGKPIIWYKPIVYSPSLTIFSLSKKKSKKAIKNYSFYGIDFINEAKELSKIFEVNPILEEEATIENFIENSKNDDIIHIACHGIFNSQNPLESGIKFYDGILTAKYILENLNLKAELITLSACDTGKNKIFVGDEFFGLTRSLFYAGTSSIMASLWPVYSKPTEKLMISFYKNIRSGKSKLVSLQISQKEMIRENLSFYYYAPFILIGKWE